tara:strand:- start:1131 stop:1301 length:171 start_codon:yes stop_codon:yes gene_type:complete
MPTKKESMKKIAKAKARLLQLEVLLYHLNEDLTLAKRDYFKNHGYPVINKDYPDAR